MSEDILFKPETDEPDPKSKPSYLQHISYKLKLSEEFECENDSGLLSTKELKSLAELIIQRTNKVESNDDSINNFLLGNFSAEDERFTFISSGKSWSQYSKPQLAHVIAGVLNFQLITKDEIGDGDNTEPHINENSGAIYLPFYKSIWENLPDPLASDEEISLVESEYVYRGVDRDTKQMTAKELVEIATQLDMSEDDWNKLDDDSKAKLIEGSTIIPEFQRDNVVWKPQNRELMIDSMLRDIPMPAIILGKSRSRLNEPWQLIDGQQRLTTLCAFFDQHSFGITEEDVHYHQLDDWARIKVDNYNFIVEKVIVEKENQLSRLYERYNTAGVRMSQPQIRVAKFHEISALHHYLLAMSGGPNLSSRATARERLCIYEDIEFYSQRAAPLRSVLPRTSQPQPGERTQLRKITEKIYDLWCRIVAYSTYHKERGDLPRIDQKDWPEYPTAKIAIDLVFRECRDGSKATKVVSKLDYIVRECSNLYGDFAFSSVKRDEDMTKKLGKDVWAPRGTIHGWAAQVQCAGIWSLSDLDVSLLAQNPDTFLSEWVEFCVENIYESRQNSGSIWKAQEDWSDKVIEIIAKIKAADLEEEDSPKRQQLMRFVDLALSLDMAARDGLIAGWKLDKSPEEFAFLMKELEERS